MSVWLPSAVLIISLVAAPALAPAKRSCAEIEAFMRKANVKVLSGVQAMMDDGTMQHRAFLHSDDEAYRTDQKFRDTWKANVAAYELAKILEINVIPPYVELQVNGKPNSVSWGLDDVIMDDVQRIQRNAQPPDLEAFNKQMYVVHVVDELIYGGRAPSDLLITKDWQLWMIGPSLGFMPYKTLKSPGSLVMSDRKLLAKMRTLDRATLTSKLGRWLTPDEIDALYARAGLIVAFFDREIASKGEAAVLFDLDRSGSPCAL